VSQTHPVRRPALVTFSAILLLMLAGFQLIVAITEFFHYAFGTLPPLVGNYNILWGLLDVVYALVLLYAGIALLQGQAVGRLITMIVAVLAALRWAFYLWYEPWASVVVIGICLLIIYAMAQSDEYFTSASA
jgi:hypothetical protein